MPIFIAQKTNRIFAKGSLTIPSFVETFLVDNNNIYLTTGDNKFLYVAK